MSVDCFMCGGAAHYTKAGPTPGVRIVDAPVGPLMVDNWKAGAPSQGVSVLPNPTVPLKMSEALLELDAERAPTRMYQGLRDEEVSPSGDSGGTLPDFNPLTEKHAVDEEARTIARQGLPAQDHEEVIPTRAVEGLSDRPIKMRALPFADEEEAIPTRAVSGLADKKFPNGALAALDDHFSLEDEIPTRAVEGLADKKIKAFARDLYDEEQQKAFDGIAIDAPPETSPLPPGAEFAFGSISIDGPVLKVATGPTSTARPSRRTGPSLDSGPGLSPSQFGIPEVETGPAQLKEKSSGPSLGLGEHPSIMNTPGLGARPTVSRSNTKLLVATGVLFIAVFALVLFGLVAYKNPAAIGLPEGSFFGGKSEEVKLEVIKLPPRHERFGLKPVDKDAPFQLETSKTHYVVEGNEATVTFEGTLVHEFSETLEDVVVGGLVGLEFGDARQTFSVTGVLKPALTKKTAWKQGSSRRFVLTSAPFSAKLISKKSLTAFFARLDILAKKAGAKEPIYQGTIHTVDVEK